MVDRPPAPPRSVEINTAALAHIMSLTGLTGSALAREADISDAFVSRLRSGKARRVSPPVYRRIMAALRIEDWRTLLANTSERATGEAAQDVA